MKSKTTKPATTACPSMSKQEKRELASNERRINALERKEASLWDKHDRAVAKIHGESFARIRKLRRATDKEIKGFSGERVTLQKRQAILLGRLSA